MDEHLPTVRSRELGDGLRAAMKKAGMGVRELSRKLDWPHPRISHLLGGKRGGSELDVVSVLVACNAGREERERLLKLCRELGTQGWLQQYGSRLPEQTRTLVDHENKAVEIQDLQLVLIPGLLQTESYARAVISRGVNAPESDIERFVHARLTRQSVFDRRPRATFYIHEYVLRLSIGGPDVMSDQLHNLLRMSVRPRLQLRVIPAAAGGHAGVAGSFKLMEFADFSPIVYLESELSAVFLELPEQIAAYQRILSSLAEVALGHEESKELITALAAELYPGEDQHDGEHLAEEFL
jgi:hypothetical protein